MEKENRIKVVKTLTMIGTKKSKDAAPLLLYLTVGPNRILLIGLFAQNAVGDVTQTCDLPNRTG